MGRFGCCQHLRSRLSISVDHHNIAQFVTTYRHCIIFCELMRFRRPRNSYFGLHCGASCSRARVDTQHNTHLDYSGPAHTARPNPKSPLSICDTFIPPQRIRRTSEPCNATISFTSLLGSCRHTLLLNGTLHESVSLGAQFGGQNFAPTE